MFYLGGKRYGLKDHPDIVAPTVPYCNPGPSLCTLDSRKLQPLYNSGPHLNNVMLLLTLLNTLDGIPCFRQPGLTKYFTVMHYDGMPLNIGTFPRQENGQTFFDGVIPVINLDKMKELYRDGNNAVHEYIREYCTWISEVKEFDLCDASGIIHLDVFTKFGSMGGDVTSVNRQLTETLQCIEACSNCLLSDNAKNCKFTSLTSVCDRCKTLDVEKNPCISARCIHVSSDQAPAQRKAHMELNNSASPDLNNQEYRSYGFLCAITGLQICLVHFLWHNCHRFGHLIRRNLRK